LKKIFPFVTAILAAAGQGTRMGGGKLFAELNGLPVVLYALKALEAASSVSEIIVVSRPEDMPIFREMADTYGIHKLTRIVSGGATRQLSVFAGISAADPQAEYYAVHDGARPLASTALINQITEDAMTHGAAAPGTAAKDTLKLRDDNGFVAETPDRSRLFAIQTPQIFRASLYRSAMNAAISEDADFTDDCQLLEHIGQKVFISRGEYSNIKITTPEDLVLAGALLENK